MQRRAQHPAWPLLVIVGSLLLAAGLRLNEEPALAAASRAVLARPVAHATAAARWILGALGAE
jgi:hypothetical protein